MRNFAMISLAGVSLLALGAPAFAQEADVADGLSDDVIIVQARRKDESIQDVPAVVQAVPFQQIQKLDIRRFEDITAVVPGLQLERAANGSQNRATMRGIDFDATASGAFTSVEFYRNDAVISAVQLFHALYDIGQIEVLRGPQGTLRGRASPSGSVTVTTRRPELSEAGGYMSGSLAEDSNWNVNGAINVPVLADKLAVRVAGFVGRNRANEVRGVTLATGDIDSSIYDRTRALRASVRADPFDGILLLDFNYETINRKTRTYDQVESRGLVDSSGLLGPRTITSKDQLGIRATPTTNDTDVKIYNWQAQLNLLGQSLTYVGARNVSNSFTVAPADNGGFFADPYAPFQPGGTPQHYAQLTGTDSVQNVHEIRLQNQERVAGLFDYVVGYMRISGTSPTLIYTPTGSGSAAGLTSVRLGGALRFRSDKEESFFGNVTVHLTESTEVSGGIRRIKFKRNSGLASAPRTSNFDQDIDSWPEVPAFALNDDLKATIYSLSAKHRFNENLMAYASFGTSFRPGNVVICTACLAFTDPLSPLVQSFLNLPDEKSKSFEIGVKTSWLDNRLRLNVSAFHQKFDNFPVRSATPILFVGATTPTVRTGQFEFVAPVEATIKGIEAELAFDVSRNFSISANLAYADGKIKDGLFPCVDLNDDNVQDATNPTAGDLFAHVGEDRIDTCMGSGSPSSSANLSGSVQSEYSMPVSNFADGFLRGLVTWKGNSEGQGPNPLDSVKAYALINLYAGVRDPDGDWELSFFAKNLTNTHRVLSRFGTTETTALQGSGLNLISDYYRITTTAPREFGVNFRMAFGSR